MIHAFLITIAVIATIYAWPFILLSLCVCFKILTSKWFWLGILGLTLFIVSCCFLGPITLLVLAIAYGMWQLMEYNQRLAYGRESMRRDYESGKLRLNSVTNNQGKVRKAVRIIDWDKLVAAETSVPDESMAAKLEGWKIDYNGTNNFPVAPIPQPKSDSIDWSKL